MAQTVQRAGAGFHIITISESDIIEAIIDTGRSVPCAYCGDLVSEFYMTDGLCWCCSQELSFTGKAG